MIFHKKEFSRPLYMLTEIEIFFFFVFREPFPLHVVYKRYREIGDYYWPTIYFLFYVQQMLIIKVLSSSFRLPLNKSRFDKVTESA